MQLSTQPIDLAAVTSQALVVFHFEEQQTQGMAALLGVAASTLNPLLDSQIITSKMGQVTPLFGHSHLPAAQVLIIGAGKASELNENAFIKLIKAALSALKNSQSSSASLMLDDIQLKQQSPAWCLERATETVLASLYEYDTTKSKKATAHPLTALSFLTAHPDPSALETGKAVAHGRNVARELGDLPANVCTPTYLAEQAVKMASAYEDLSVEVLDQAAMNELNMGAYLAVSQGSSQPPQFIVMHYLGGEADAKPHVLVGKGLTFDSGGISIKPAQGMEDMKYDMLGAASVFGTLASLAELKAAVNVVGVVAAAENMCSGNATRPGDVVTSMSGKTIEVINTDAEGRLVLCDALAYVERFEPASVIDIATLTGAVIVALGHHATAIYANDDELQQALVAAGQTGWDRGWPMPLWPEYGEELKSPYADLRNIGLGRAAGSITAASFLSEFTGNYRWAHLDIAGAGWASAKEGATGRPVGMLVHYLLEMANSLPA